MSMIGLLPRTFFSPFGKLSITLGFLRAFPHAMPVNAAHPPFSHLNDGRPNESA